MIHSDKRPIEDFFPKADVEETPSPISPQLAMIVRAMTCEKPLVAFAAAVLDEDGGHTIYRFCVPNHNRLCRMFFRLANIEPTLTQKTYDVENGAFIIKIEGIRVGTDEVPSEGLMSSIIVLDKVKITEPYST